MKFSRHISSHLTPEWRKQYIQYADLKKLVYDMVGSKKSILGIRPHNREELDADEVLVDVDETLQEAFFRLVHCQLQSITQFFRKEESGLQFSLSELEDQVLQLAALTARKASKQRQVLKRAFSEIYLNIILLQNFQQLNHTGFRKILKKHDKLTRSTRGKDVFKDYVCQAYFWTSKCVMDMLGRVEKHMIQLEGGNRTKAMNRLRVPPLGTEHRRSQWTSYFAGLFCGMLLLSVIVVCVAFGLWPKGYDIDTPHLEPSLRGMRAGLVLSLWFFGFAVNTFGWRRAGVNNVLIFEFNPRHYLNFVELFAVAGMISCIWMTGLYLVAFAPWLNIPLYVGPIVMYGMLVSLLVLPLPTLRLRSRVWLLKRLGRIMCAPFFNVEFADFWLADQLTSLSLAMLDTEYFFCYLFYGRTAPEGAIFSCGTGSYGFRVIVAVLPAWWRFAQCLRRYYDTKEANPHLINAGKYSTSFFVAVFSAVASAVINNELRFLEQSILYLAVFALWVLSAVVSTSYTFSWDILMDWSLFPNIPQRCCHKNALMLRQDTIYSYKIYYVLAIVEDFLFRILWIFNLSVGHHVLGLLNDDLIATIAGVLEIVRRFVWNFFRVENEHVTNVGQFRAVRDISLYPVDLSSQAEQEDNEDSATDGPHGPPDRRAHWGSPGKKKRPLVRKLSNTLQEVADPKNKTARKRSRTGSTPSDPPLSATLPLELRQIEYVPAETVFDGSSSPCNNNHDSSSPSWTTSPANNSPVMTTLHDTSARLRKGSGAKVSPTSAMLSHVPWPVEEFPVVTVHKDTSHRQQDTLPHSDSQSSQNDSSPSTPLDDRGPPQDDPLDNRSPAHIALATHLDSSSPLQVELATHVDDRPPPRDELTTDLGNSSPPRDELLDPPRDEVATHVDDSQATHVANLPVTQDSSSPPASQDPLVDNSQIEIIPTQDNSSPSQGSSSTAQSLT